MDLILELPRIVQAAAEAGSPAEQVEHLVDAIHRDMDVDVCSLYLANDEGEMVLVASHGLAVGAVGQTRLPHGRGLIGLVARSRHPLNIIEPSEHPDFVLFRDIGEEKFHSFCAVPLIRAGKTVGVLAVQCLQPRLLSSQEEAFLVTLGAQLALVVTNWQDWQGADPTLPRIFSGLRGAPGIGIGLTHLCDDSDLLSVVEAPSHDKQRDVENWRALLERVRGDVTREQQTLGSDLSGEVAAIFDAYLMLLADPALVAGVERAIEGGRDLPSALRSVILHYSELFKAMDDPYLRARHEDIRHLGNRLYSAWRGDRSQVAPVEGSRPLVLIGSEVSVSDIASLPRKRVAGIVSLKGSTMSHAAILANALGIPAVMGIGSGHTIDQGEPVIVDANLGQVLLNPAPAVTREYRRLAAEERAVRGRLAGLRDEPAVTLDGERVLLLVNSGLLADLSPGLEAGAEGIGLYRTEIPFMVREGFPTEEEQLHIYSQVLDAYNDKPVYMRILDIGGDKPLPYFPISEENPALGWRGIRFCLDNSSLLMTQVRAMLRADPTGHRLRILLPMVSALDELSRFRELLDDALEQLRQEGVAVERPAVGVMIEVPAAITMLAQWRQQLDFISVGSNDLSQYLLAVDRNNPRVAAAYDHLNPAVVLEVERIAQCANSLSLPMSVCGEMSSDPAAAILLIGMGVRTLSMSAAQLPRIKWLVQHLDTTKARALLDEVRSLHDANAVRSRLHGFLVEIDYPALPSKAV
jgi:phosphotransferase system enzyme I (PtsI)/phosphotransferase system enzyme I (PtsP)